MSEEEEEEEVKEQKAIEEWLKDALIQVKAHNYQVASAVLEKAINLIHHYEYEQWERDKRLIKEFEDEN